MQCPSKILLGISILFPMLVLSAPAPQAINVGPNGEITLTPPGAGSIPKPQEHDFRIYTGTDNTMDGAGGGQAFLVMQMFKQIPPACGDLGSYYINSDNDASSGGWACDGCDWAKPDQDWIIDRFEIYNQGKLKSFDRETGAVTLYGTGAGNYDMRTNNGELVGHCGRTGANPHVLHCPASQSAAHLTHVLTCTSSLTPA